MEKTAEVIIRLTLVLSLHLMGGCVKLSSN